MLPIDLIQKGDLLYLGGDAQKWVECAVPPWCVYLSPHQELYPRWRVRVWSQLADSRVICVPADCLLIESVVRAGGEVWNQATALIQQSLFELEAVNDAHLY